MASSLLVLPMFAMVLLTYVVLVMLFRRRVLGVKRGEVSAGYYKLYQGQTESEDSRKLSRHFINLFETPVLFYAVCIAAIATTHSTTALQLLAWAYVIARIVHAFVHIGRNKIPTRIAVYVASWLILLAMWVCLALQVLWSTGLSL